MKLNHPADTIVEGIVNSPINNLSAPNYWPLNEQCFPSYRNQSIHLHCKWINLFLYDRKHWSLHCVESVQIRSYFWSVFSCIRTGYGDLLVNLHIQSHNKKIRTKNNSAFGHFSRSVNGLRRPLVCRMKWLHENFNHFVRLLPYFDFLRDLDSLFWLMLGKSARVRKFSFTSLAHDT